MQVEMHPELHTGFVAWLCRMESVKHFFGVTFQQLNAIAAPFTAHSILKDMQRTLRDIDGRVRRRVCACACPCACVCVCMRARVGACVHVHVCV
jgi:hypothetical protein